MVITPSSGISKLMYDLLTSPDLHVNHALEQGLLWQDQLPFLAPQQSTQVARHAETAMTLRYFWSYAIVPSMWV